LVKLVSFDKRNKIAIYEANPPVKILCLGDIHLGNPATTFKLENFKFNEHYFVLLGDLLEMVTKNSPGMLYHQESPAKQVDKLKAFLEKYSGRVLGLVSGNHDDRVSREVGVDVLEMLCERFQIPYSPHFLIIHISLSKGGRRNSIVLALHHGVAGGRSKSASVRQGEYFERFLSHGVDIYVSGHTHKPALVPFSHRFYDVRRKKLEYVEGLLVTVPSFLKDDYFSLKRMFEANSLQIPSLTLDLDLRYSKRKVVCSTLV